MRYRTHAIASIVIVLAMAGVAAAAVSRLPPGARLATHWGADGMPDRFASAGQALLLPVAITAIGSLLMAALPAIEPLQHRMEASAPLYRTAWGGLLALMGCLELMIAAPAFGVTLAGTALLAVLGVFLIVLGNALPKSRPSFFVGVRTPWTLSDPENWIATHRYASRLMIAGGVGLLVLAFVPLPCDARQALVTATLLVVATTPILYSFFLWRRVVRQS